MESFDERKQLVKLIVSRWDEYKFIAKLFGLKVDGLHTISERKSDQIKRAEYCLSEQKYNLKVWLDNP